MTRSALADSTSAFIGAVTEELAALSNRPASSFLREAAAEAANIVAGVMSSDGRCTDGELDAYLDVLGPLLDPPLTVSTAAAREMNLFAGKRDALGTPSVMLDLLASADAKHGTRRSHRHYDAALRLAHVAAAIDLVPSGDELVAIDEFRSMMLRHFDALAVPRPGRPVAGTSASGSPPAVASAVVKEPAAAAEVQQAPARSIAELLAELDDLVGLLSVKAEVRRLSSLLQVQQLRAERGLPVIETSHHLVFTGNPGTGKTTVARLLSQVYRSVGVVTKGHLVETDRSKLVAGYVGQTALKTQAALEASLGGMLLIDEAYALARGGDDDFGREAIDTLVKFMEDHRDDVAIVAAGYPDEMADFIDANPGLKSRFTRTVSFPDYTDDELLSIFVKLGEKNSYHLSDDALAKVRHFIAAEPRTRGFGNARYVRNLFETAVAHQAERVAPLHDPSNEQLTTLTGDDIAPVDA
ncbi:MAG: AAA family ATPase [Actinomycetota bacterium]|nr:AAA family ATPase [Actinomycetota bacterium]